MGSVQAAQAMLATTPGSVNRIHPGVLLPHRGKIGGLPKPAGALPMIDHLDHLVLTTHHEAACVDFYTRVLGMRLETFVGGTPPVERKAFKYGAQKINLHVQGREFEPKAHLPVPGALDLCFIASVPLAQVIERLNPVLETPSTLLMSEGDHTRWGPGGLPVHPEFRLFATLNPAEY